MRAVVLEEYNTPFRVREVEEPRPGVGEVLVEVKACGVCGSDRFLQEGGFNSALPIVPGHEASGEVVEIGAGVTGVAPGDRVVIYYILHCGSCRYCLCGYPNMCVHVRRIGVDVNGAMAEKIVVPARNVIRIPGNVDYFTAAVITDAIGTAVHAIRLANVRMGESVLVVGVGGIGSNVVQIAKRMGAFVIAASRSIKRLQLALELGADATLTMGDELEHNVRSLTEGIGADVIVQCAPGRYAYEAVLGCLANRGRLVMVGSCAEHVSVHVMKHLIWREGAYFGSRGFTPSDIIFAFSWYLRGMLRADHLTRTFLPMEEINRAIANLGDPDVLRTIVVP
jgi:propanol-preferring alcohol dehydrogenase